MSPVELWDLVSAFGRLMRETMALQPQDIVVDQTPLHVYMDTILKRLEQETRILFSSLFTPPHTRSRLVGLFLAVLELTKGRRITPEQTVPFSDIWLSLAPASPAGRPSNGLKEFLWLLSDVQQPRVLDLGNVSQSTLNFFINKGFRISTEDILRSWKEFIASEEDALRRMLPGQSPELLGGANRVR